MEASKPMEELIELYCRTRLDYDEKHEASSLADAAHKAAKARLVEAMIDAKEKGKTMDYGLRFNLRNQFSIRCNADNEIDVKDWLHERYGDVNLFTVEKVSKKAVEEKLKEDIEGEVLDEFDVPDFMALKTRPDVSCTGWKQYSANQRGK